MSAHYHARELIGGKSVIRVAPGVEGCQARCLNGDCHRNQVDKLSGQEENVTSIVNEFGDTRVRGKKLRYASLDRTYLHPM